MNPKRLIFAFLYFFIATIGYCQQDIAELKKSLKVQTNTAARMHIQLELGDRYQSINPDSSLFWYNAIIPKGIADSLGLHSWYEEVTGAERYYVAVALARSGLILIQSRRLEQGAANLEKGYVIARLLEQFDLALYCSDNLSVAFARAKRVEEASRFFEESLGIYRQQNNEEGIIHCLGNLGAMHASMKNYYQAAEYYELLLSHQQQSNSPLSNLDDMMNIAALYNLMGEEDKAKNAWERALNFSNQVNDPKKTSQILANLGAITYKQGDFKSAEIFYNQLLELSKQNQNSNDELLALNNLAVIAYNLNELDSSIGYWESTLNLGFSLGNGQAVLDALINLSNLSYQQKDFDKAAEYYERYMLIGSKIGNPVTMANSYASIAEIQERIGNFDKARDYYQESLKIYLQLKDTVGLAKTNILIGKTFQRQHRYFTAMEFFRANLEILSSVDEKTAAATYQGMADIYRMQMQYPMALDNYQKALDLYIESEENNLASVCLNAMGTIHQVTGDYPKAVSYLETALRLVRQMGNKEGAGAVLNNLGIVYRQLGDLQKARESYQRALDISTEIGNVEGTSYSFNNLGIVFEQLGDYEKANEYYQRSLEIKQETNDKFGLAASYLNMGNVFKRLKDYEKAEEFFNLSHDMSREVRDKQGRALALGSLASLMVEKKDYESAIEYAKSCLEVAKEIDMKSTIKEAYRQLAWAYNASNFSEWAEEAFLNVISMNYDDINRNFSFLSESEKELFFRTVSEDFDRFYSFAMKRMVNNPTITQDVYNNLLKNKGLLLKSSTAMRNAILGSNNPKLIENFEKWIQIKQEIAKLYTLPIEERDQNPEDLEKKANELERLLVRTSSEFSDFEKSLKADWTTVRNSLKEGEAAIEFTNFVHSRDSVMYCALIVTPDSENPLMVPLFEEKALTKVLGSFAGNNFQYIKNVYSCRGFKLVDQKNEDQKAAETSIESLYDIIWKPMEPFLKGVSSIHFSPSGLLHKVSFSAISQDVNSYLIDSYQLHVQSTTANIANVSKFTIDKDMTITLFGGITYTTEPTNAETWNYLKGTLDEALMIEGLLQNEFKYVYTITDIQATEERFKSLATRSQVLHIATHGFFFPDPSEIQQKVEALKEEGDIDFRGGSPTFGMTNFVKNQNPLMRSGLVFAGVNDYWTGTKAVASDDGVLTALEVINIDLRKNILVVMSACETGLGDIAGSEGVYGLQRAFKMAGTNYLIMSLWQVPDKETAEFMENFYTELVKTRDLQKAFTNTQNTMRQLYDPFFWAAFVLLE